MQSERHFHLSIPALKGEYVIDVWGKPSGHDNESRVNSPEELIEWYQHHHGVTLRFLEQTHGDQLVETGSGDPVCWGKADAAVSRDISHAVAIRTADCIPLLFFHTGELFFGGIHAGWRGLHNRIIEKTFSTILPARNRPAAKKEHEELKNPKGALFLFTGPYISARRYETGPEVYENFDEDCSEDAPGQNKKYLNMKKITARQLASPSIEPHTLLRMDACTWEDRRFYSHRRGDTGRNFSVIFHCENEIFKKK